MDNKQNKKKTLEGIKNYSHRLGTLFPENNTSTEHEKKQKEHNAVYGNSSLAESPMHIKSASQLVRRDLLTYEHILCRDFAKLITFEGHALYFPTQDELQDAEYIEKEKKLLLPLRRNSALLGVLLLRKVRVQKSLIPFLTHFASICLENIYLMKMSRLDERCQLIRLPYFMERVYREVSSIKKYFAQSIAQSYAQSASGLHALTENFTEDESKFYTETYHTHNTSVPHQTNPHFDLETNTHARNEPHQNQVERQTSIGLMVLPILGLNYIKKYFGFTVAEQIFIQLAHKVQERLPDDALCTVLDNENFAVYYSGATKRIMENLAKECANLEVSMHAMPLPTMFASLEHLMGDSMLLADAFTPVPPIKNDSTVKNINENILNKIVTISTENSLVDDVFMQERKENCLPLQGVRVEAKLCAGYALFPQDWDGTLHSQESAEIPHILLEKARTAALRLKNKPLQKGRAPEQAEFHIAGQTLGFKQILAQSGSIEEILPYSQVRVNLGTQDGTLENMCFRVWADVKRTRYKGEILLSQVQETHSIGQILLLSDPAKNLEAGDFLEYAPESLSQSEALGENQAHFYAYQDFMDAVSENVASQHVQTFSLSLLRVHGDIQLFRNAQDNVQNHSHKKDIQEQKKSKLDPINMKELARHVYRYIKAYNEKNASHIAQNTEPLVGSMSFNSILVYHPDMDTENAHILYTKIANMIKKNLGLPCAIGVAVYPFLTLRPADMWESCRKALDYAMLLPAPHVGVFDSLAMNISADRKFSQGDTFGAVEEYRMALLADGDNILAWNSLGVCLAELGRHAEARNAFEVAYARNQKDAPTCYNLGSANLSLNDREKAKEYFLVCLSQDKKHLYARIRLGEIAEKEELFTEAHEQYTLASMANPDSSVPLRGLARLAMRQNEKERARELLQMALQKNSDDAVSLQLLAGLYLDGGEDAHLAEMLARQSVALLPWRRSAWSELARALEAQEKFAEAAQVRRNTMRL